MWQKPADMKGDMKIERKQPGGSVADNGGKIFSKTVSANGGL